MSSLSNIPSDILCYITNRLKARHIALIWFCGDKILNRCLSKGGGVKRFIFSPKSRFAFWPHIVSQFVQLSHFSLIITSKILSNFPIDLPLQTLPRNLTYLALNSPNDVLSFEHAYRKDPLLFSQLKSLSISGKDGERDTNLLYELKLPNLTDLNLNTSMLCCTLIVDHVPNGLTRFSGVFPRIEVLKSEVCLPKTLTSVSLTLGNYEEWIPIFNVLPTQLVAFELRFIGYNIPKASEHYWMELPEKLVSLSIECPSFGPTHAGYLPSTLKNLTLIKWNFCEDDLVLILNSLPSQLESIHGLFKDKFEITEEIARAMPRTLKDFANLMKIKVKFEAIPSLPQSIQFVRCFDSRATKKLPKDFSFPKHLEELTIDDITMDIARLLPQTLTDLSVAELDFGYLSAELLNLLPSRLTSLYTSEDRPIENLEMLKHLPTGLKVLELNPPNFHEDFFHPIPAPPLSSQWLPRHLIQLSLPCLDISQSEWFAYLPPSLQRFCLRCLDIPQNALLSLPCHLTSLSFELQKHPSIGYTHHFKQLPKQLKRLQIIVAQDDKLSGISNEDMLLMPPTLKYLWIPMSPQIDELCNPKLQSQLSTFYIGSSNPQWFTEKV
jgi:hypothetical protein